MGLKVSAKSASNIPPLEGGIYTAVCVWVVDLGEQKSEKFNKYQKKLLFGFEICGEDIERGNGPEPRMLSRQFTASLNEKAALRQMLVSWRGRAFTDDDLETFDVGCMLGESAQVQVLVNDDGRNDIQNIIPLSRGMKAQIPRMELVIFDLDDPDSYSALEKLPDWIRDKVEKSTEWAQLNANQQRLGMGEDEQVDMETGEVTRRPSTSRKAGKTPF